MIKRHEEDMAHPHINLSYMPDMHASSAGDYMRSRVVRECNSSIGAVASDDARTHTQKIQDVRQQITIPS